LSILHGLAEARRSALRSATVEERKMATDIEQFRRRLLAFQFAKKAFAELDNLHASGTHRRNEPGVRDLIEEVLPIACFAKHLEGPECHIKVRYYGGNEKFDGKLWMHGAVVKEGYCQPEYYLEVTSAISSTEYVQREALERYGYVFVGPDVQRIGSKRKGGDRISSQPRVAGRQAHLQEVREWVLREVSEKSKKNYPPPCFLIVRVEPDSIFSPFDWYDVAKEVSEALPSNAFAGVWMRNTSSGIVLQ
jgi:hypothetical protein